MTAKQSPLHDTQSQKKMQPQAKEPISANALGSQMAIADYPNGLYRVADNPTGLAQAAWLGRAELQQAQRIQLASQIGHLHGNQHLQQVIQIVGGNGSGANVNPINRYSSTNQIHDAVSDGIVQVVRGQSRDTRKANLQRQPQKNEPNIALAASASQKQSTAESIRRLFPGGIMLILSIPNAFESQEEAEKAEEYSGYAYQRTWQLLGVRNSGAVQPYWDKCREEKFPEVFGAYDVAEEQQLEKQTTSQEQGEIAQAWRTANQLAVDLHKRLRPKERQEKRKEHQAQLALINAIKKAQNARRREALKTKWRRKAWSKIPENVDNATKREQAIINSITFVTYSGEVKNDLMKNHRKLLASTERVNNEEFQRSARDYAASHNAVAVENGQVVLGKHMTYGTSEEIATHALAVHGSVLSLLRDCPSDPPSTKLDVQTARIRYLGLLSHGWPKGMGGKHRAKKTKFVIKDVKRIVSAMSDILAPDIRLVLFACSAAADIAPKKPKAGEGSLADTFRNLLLEQHSKATVVGHITAGHTVRNRNLRVFHGRSSRGRTFVLNNQNEGQLLPEAFVNSEITRLGLVSENPTILDGRKKRMRTEMQDFYASESWLFSSMGTPDVSWKSLSADFQSAWLERISPNSAVALKIRGRSEKKQNSTDAPKRRGRGKARKKPQKTTKLRG